MKKRKKSLAFDSPPPYTFIVSEGTKTEPAYMEGFVFAINQKFSHLGKDRIKVKGTGRSCTRLLEYTREIVEKEMPMAEVVWLMYDKDDFPKDAFDNTVHSIKDKIDKRTYKSAWSNESLELWFLMHFQEYSSNNGRDDYTEKLKQYMDYKKNDPELYKKLQDKTNQAILRAKKAYEKYPEGTPPSKCFTTTKVYELVEELQKYL